MKILLVMAEKNLRLIFKDKLSIVQLFIPIIIIMISIKLFSFSNGTVKIGIIDEDCSDSSKLLISSLSNNSSISTVPLEGSTAESTMLETSIPVTIEIPKDFEESIINGSPEKINVFSEKDSSMGDAITSLVNLQVEDLYNLGINSNKNNDEYENLLLKYSDDPVKITSKTLSDLENDFELTQTAIAFVIFFLMMRASSISYIILSERWNKTYYRIFTTPVTSFQYIGGNILANFSLLAFQLLITLITLNYFVDIYTGLSFIPLFLLLLGIALVTVAFGIFSIALFFNSKGYGMFSNIVITITTMVSGAFTSINFLPESVRFIAPFTPQYWVMNGINKLQMGMGTDSIIINLGILLLFSIALFLAAAYKLKFKLQ
ncbi:MAG: ABC transporter permease [Clostridium sulfidigenes]|uniref:ABC transporter permease n=1 Tax=Clostridium sulfidigenes TaxID=318464 RepID=A0A927ZI34_9CLOT|nr:ABC transporter permease [Clostridium sulfidigenes]